MKKIHIKQMNLRLYRNFDEFHFNPGSNVNLIIGNNGVGKTNILESISLLYPGRGIRSCPFGEICMDTQNNWQSKFILTSRMGEAEIRENYLATTKQRKISYNGSTLASSELAKLTSIVWMTPQMEDLFITTKSIRRNYFDRLSYNFFPNHAVAINNYMACVKQRLAFLSREQFGTDRDFTAESYLNAVEKAIAEEAVIIYYNRQDAIKYVHAHFAIMHKEFPRAKIKIESEMMQELEEIDKEQFILYYIEKLKQSRRKDKFSGRSNFGVHRCDFVVYYEAQNVQARKCSTGEQKALLLSILLSHVSAILTMTKITPILLLDEIFVHLDEVRTNYLVEYLQNSNAQIFITATDLNNIKKLAADAMILNL